MCLCRFFDAQNKKVGMPLRLLVGTEEWIVPYDGYTPRWQDLCDPREVQLTGHTASACWQNLMVQGRKRKSLCLWLSRVRQSNRHNKTRRLARPSITLCSSLSRNAVANREWIVSGDGQVRIEMVVTAQNRGQACSPTCSRSNTTLTCRKSLTLFIILAVMQRVESATTPTGNQMSL